MKPYYRDNLVTHYKGDARDMSELPDGSVQMVCTSPPFWGLRKYAGDQDLIWGGDKDCEHKWDVGIKKWHSGTNAGLIQLGDRGAFHNNFSNQTNTCPLCGAWKGAYGLELTPEMYIEHTIQILREIRRVLRKDGVVFWDIGDSYAGSWGNSGSREGGQRQQNQEKIHRKAWDNNTERPASSYRHSIIKPKDLCLIPFRVAIAAQEDGWWVRSVIIWSKSNPMPESVTDRPTESHEYILMLTKNKNYYWDADAVREPQSLGTHSRGKTPIKTERSIAKSIQANGQESHKDWFKYTNEWLYHPLGRNIRTVWEFPTQPYPEAHFAVFPEKLPEICIRAATPEVGCCSKCGAPWVRIIDKSYNIRAIRAITEKQYKSVGGSRANMPFMGDKITQTLGWQPTCKCDADKVPSLVLDLFAGSGTTLAVAKREGRRAVGYELSGEYCKLIVERVMAVTPPIPGL